MAQEIINIASEPVVTDMANSKRVLRIFIIIAVAWLPALIGSDAVRSAAALFALANSPNPYFVPDHAWTLYLWAPIVVVSACLLFLSPGLFLSIAINSAQNVGHWILSGLALSLIVLSIVTGIVQWIMGNPLRDGAFAAVVIACSLGSLGFLLFRLSQNRPMTWPLGKPYAGNTVLSIVVVPLLILITLTPKFYWENFNGDGAHAFESARLLFFQSLPFWGLSAGDVASLPGITSMLFVFPTSWFIRLFGQVEASARLPILLYLAALYGVILAIVEHGRTKTLGLAERWLIWLGLGVYTVAMVFSATYNPYSADIGLPATQDTLMMVCFLGFILSFLRRERGWMYLFIGMTFLSLPNGMFLIGLWLLSVILLWKPRPWGEVVETGAALLVCFLIAALIPPIFTALHFPSPGQEYGPVGLLRHFAWLQWADWHRIAFLVVPSGFLPAIALLAWRWQNHVARALTIVTVAYFFLFYVQAHIVLHYFVPVMLIPLIVFWQNDLMAQSNRRLFKLACAGLAGILALLISLPTNFTPDTSARIVGSAIEDRIGGYEVLDPAAFKSSEILQQLFPVDWDPRVPFESYGGSPVAWNYYAHRTDGVTRNVNYVLQATTDPSPVGMRIVAVEGNVALYVRSKSVWASHRDLRPPTPAGSRVYGIQRGIIFRSVPLKNGPPIIAVVDVIESFGIDMDPILNRLGAKR